MGRFIVPILSLMWAFDAGAWPRADIPTALAEAEPTVVATQSGPVSLSQARQMALQRFPGRVARAETVTAGGNRRVHQIRILDAEGRVRNVRVDAQTGAFL